MLSWLKKDGAVGGTESDGESGMERACCMILTYGPCACLQIPLIKPSKSHGGNGWNQFIRRKLMDLNVRIFF